MTKDRDPAHIGPVLAEHGEYRIVDCEVCGFAHCLPIPGPEELAGVYGEEYYSKVKPDYISKVETDRVWHDLVSNQRLERLETLTTGRRLLEIGSGPGFFLDAARKRGWDVLGFEPSRQAWQYSSELLALPVRNEFFSEETSRHVGSFDAIYLALVLEHVADPLGLMRVVKACLNPGGAICVAVPNDFSPVQRYLYNMEGYSQWWVSPPHHINYFTHATLSHMLRKSGFQVQNVSSSFPIDLFLLMGFDYTKDDALGRRMHNFRICFEHALEKAGLGNMRSSLYATLAEYGVGREAVVFASAE